MNSRRLAKDCRFCCGPGWQEQQLTDAECARPPRSWLRPVLSTATPCPGEENIWVYTVGHLLSHWNFVHGARMWHSKSLARLSVLLLAESRQRSPAPITNIFILTHTPALTHGTSASPGSPTCPPTAGGQRGWCCHLSAARSTAGTNPAGPPRPPQTRAWKSRARHRHCPGASGYYEIKKKLQKSSVFTASRISPIWAI